MKIDKIIVGENEYKVFIHLEQRESSRVSIGRTGVQIRLPLELSREEQFKEILRLKKWAIEKLKEKPPEFKHKGSRKYNNGDKLQLGNEEYLLSLSFSEKQSSSAKAVGNAFYLTVSSILPEEAQRQHISVLLSRLIAQKKKQYIESKIHSLNQKYFNFKFKRIFLKYNSSNWGSCSHSDNINISTRSLFAPEEVIDYVCIHELAHLQEKNHSSNFWELVEKAMPNYEEKREWLKENSDKCWF